MKRVFLLLIVILLTGTQKRYRLWGENGYKVEDSALEDYRFVGTIIKFN